MEEEEERTGGEAELLLLLPSQAQTKRNMVSRLEQEKRERKKSVALTEEPCPTASDPQ